MAREELRLIRTCRKKEEILLKKAEDEAEERRKEKRKEKDRFENLEKRFSKLEEKQDKMLEGDSIQFL